MVEVQQVVVVGGDEERGGLGGEGPTEGGEAEKTMEGEGTMQAMGCCDG